MKKKKSFLYPIIFMSAVTAVFTFILAFLNYSTAERVELLQDTDLRKKILYVFDIPMDTNDPTEIEEIFNAHVKEDDSVTPSIFYLEENGAVTAYAVPSNGAGLWGGIDAYVGISADYSKILGIEFITHSETPGLGGRISEPEYLEQFRNLDISNANGSNYIVYRPASGGNVDAITGATLTSKAVSVMVNDDLNAFLQERKGD